jgi:putative ABC transport system substrate-binding protein
MSKAGTSSSSTATRRGGPPELAIDLVRTKPDLIIAAGGDVAPFAKRATDTIPIVMITSADPVQGGLVASLGRPGGNVTGVTFVSSDLAGKRLQFLKEAAPAVTRAPCSGIRTILTMSSRRR